MKRYKHEKKPRHEMRNVLLCCAGFGLMMDTMMILWMMGAI